MPATLSIITCTRNPRADLLRRVMASVAALKVPAGESIEFLLIDSASAPPLAERREVTEFLAAHRFARIVRSDEPGHALARRVGVRESVAPILIWFDDDNVPAPDYLEQVIATARAHPEVAVWGAGTIRVEFVDPVPASVEPTGGTRSAAAARAPLGLATMHRSSSARSRPGRRSA
jgi:glycosyltransferase involved in cell wall biosynthesis